MKVQCTSSNREFILYVMETELGERAAYSGLPDCTYNVGNCRLQRDGWIVSDTEDSKVFEKLAELGLCEYPVRESQPDEMEIIFPMNSFTGTALVNLICIISARQNLINRALDIPNAFFIAEDFMKDLLTHPPETIPEFMRCLYNRGADYKGVRFDRSYVSFTGFSKGHVKERPIHQQLADLIVKAAKSNLWTKAFTPNVRNKKFAFRSWLNSIGMIGPEYEEARSVMLHRLYGRADRRSIPKRKEQSR